MFLQQLINGLTIGSTYALVAIGFSMVFGVIKLTNFANGSLYMLGAYLSLMLYLLTGQFCGGIFAELDSDRNSRILSGAVCAAVPEEKACA